MRLLLLGGPGCGKGTQAARLTQRLELDHISAGDLLRAEVRSGSDVGRKAAAYLDRGALVPDDLIVELITPAAQAAARRGGYLLDGFPRNFAQAQIASDAWEPLGIAVEAVIYLEVPDAELERRLLARAQIEGRSDDTPEVIAKRLRVFAETTFPLVEYYRERGQLIPIAADQTPDEVTADIMRELDRFPSSASAGRRTSTG